MVYIFLADGFEEIEAIAPLDILRRAKIEVQTVGVTGEFVMSSRGVTIKADTTKYNNDNLDMLVLPGGSPGATNLQNSNLVQSAIGFAAGWGKYIAAICASPAILARHDYLQNKKATCYPSFAGELQQHKVIYIDEPVVVYENYITANSAGSSLQFGFKLAEILGADANKIAKSMLATYNG